MIEGVQASIESSFDRETISRSTLRKPGEHLVFIVSDGVYQEARVYWTHLSKR